MNPRLSLAAIAAWLAVSAAVADVVVMKNGEQITGKVTRFEHGERSLANSHFVVEVDGKEREIPLFKIDTVTFDTATQAKPERGAGTNVAGRSSPEADGPPAKSPPRGEKDSENGGYWLSSTGKRHNSSCRYYKSSKGHACGPKDGVACKSCGG